MIGGAESARSMLRVEEDMNVHYMRPHEVQARWVMRTRSSTEGVGALFA